MDRSRKAEAWIDQLFQLQAETGIIVVKDICHRFVEQEYPISRICSKSGTEYDDLSGTVLESVEEQLKKLESLWAVTNDKSKIYAVNQSRFQSVIVSDSTVDLLHFSVEMS